MLYDYSMLYTTSRHSIIHHITSGSHSVGNVYAIAVLDCYGFYLTSRANATYRRRCAEAISFHTESRKVIDNANIMDLFACFLCRTQRRLSMQRMNICIMTYRNARSRWWSIPFPSKSPVPISSHGSALIPPPACSSRTQPPRTISIRFLTRPPHPEPKTQLCIAIATHNALDPSLGSSSLLSNLDEAVPALPSGSITSPPPS
ncbi:hypothetical protein V8B97DRAFT_1455711 [Scleroderma yunnanense]